MMRTQKDTWYGTGEFNLHPKGEYLNTESLAKSARIMATVIENVDAVVSNYVNKTIASAIRYYLKNLYISSGDRPGTISVCVPDEAYQNGGFPLAARDTISMKNLVEDIIFRSESILSEEDDQRIKWAEHFERAAKQLRQSVAAKK